MRNKSRWWCVVPQCHSDTRKSIVVYPFMRGVRFFPFPTKKKPYMRHIWTKLIRRGDDWDGPKKHHRICSRHFVDGEPTPQNPTPSIFPWTPSQTIFPKTDYRKRKNRILYGGHNPMTTIGTDAISIPTVTTTIENSNANQIFVSQVSLFFYTWMPSVLFLNRNSLGSVRNPNPKRCKGVSIEMFRKLKKSVLLLHF